MKKKLLKENNKKNCCVFVCVSKTSERQARTTMCVQQQDKGLKMRETQTHAHTHIIIYHIESDLVSRQRDFIRWGRNGNLIAYL